MLVTRLISFTNSIMQLSVNSSSLTFKFLFLVATSNMLVYMVHADFH